MNLFTLGRLAMDDDEKNVLQSFKNESLRARTEIIAQKAEFCAVQSDYLKDLFADFHDRNNDATVRESIFEEMENTFDELGADTTALGRFIETLRSEVEG